MSVQVIRSLVPSVVRIGSRALATASTSAIAETEKNTTVHLKPQMMYMAEPVLAEDYKKKMREAAAAAAKAGMDKILEPAFMEKVKDEAKKIGHICDDWEFHMDEPSPSEWCPGCRHVDDWEHTVRWEKERRNPPAPRPVYTGPSRKEVEEARWRKWCAGLNELQRIILKSGGVDAYVLVKEEFYGQKIGWCNLMDMADPGWDTRVLPPVPRQISLPLPAPVVVKEKPKALATIKEKPAVKKPTSMWAAFDSSDESEEEALVPHMASEHHSTSVAESCANWRGGSSVAEEEAEEGGWETTVKTRFPDPFEGFGAAQWLKRKAERAFGKDKRSPEAREKELASWLAEKPRRIFTAEGYQPAKRYEVAKRSSLLVTGYGKGVTAADVRLLAAICGPVRDVFSPRSGNLMFVEYMDPEAAGRAKALFAEHAVVLGGQRIIFDISKPKGDQKPKSK
jgi:hypothetical protein